MEHAAPPKKLIVAYYIMTLMFWASSYAFVPYLSAYANGVTASAALVGVMLGAYGWAQLLLRWPIGMLADRYDKHLLFIRLGCLSNLIAAVGFFFAPNIYWMILCRTLNGVASATWVAMTVLFSTYFTGEARVKSLATLNSFNQIGQLSAALAAMGVTAVFGMRAAFALAAVIAVVPVTISLLLKKRGAARAPVSMREMLGVARSPWIWTVGLMSAVCHIMLFASLSGFTPQLALRLGASSALLGLIQFCTAGGGAVCTLLLGKYVIGRCGARNTVIVLLLIQAVTVILQPMAQTVAALYALIAVCGAATGGSVSLLLGLATVPFSSEKRSAAMGMYQAIYSLGIVLGPTVAGVVMQLTNLNAAFFSIGLFGLIAPLLGLVLLKDERKLLTAEGAPQGS